MRSPAVPTTASGPSQRPKNKYGEAIAAGGTRARVPCGRSRDSRALQLQQVLGARAVGPNGTR
eukprot:8690254-Alexandrium_andersonii.AAC.1